MPYDSVGTNSSRPQPGWEDSEEAVLSKPGLDFHVLDSGSCGMAGAFGFEREHYDVSIKLGERVLLPAVRKADEDTFIIADGFSLCN